MKLTSANSKPYPKQTGTEKISKLKKMIQSAANQAVQKIKPNPIDKKSTHVQSSHDNSFFPKHLKKSRFIASREHSEISVNQEKQNLWIRANTDSEVNLTKNEKTRSVKRLKKQASPSQKRLNRSQSNYDIKSRHIRMISKHKDQKVKKEFTIDMFRLGRKLGRGRFGNVYMAQQKQTEFVLAIKIINKKQLQQSQMQEQLLSQIKIQSYVNHPNVLKMYGFFHDKTNIYILLELAEGCLFKTLRNNEYFTQSKAAYYIKQVLQSLKYLHNQYIIHRDIKPENIMIVNNVLKLGDFGWSVYSPLYKRRTFCGTLDYVPPEIVEGNFYDEKVDVWSLGILMYELTTGKAPFEDNDSEDATFMKIMEGNVTLPEKMSQRLGQLVQRILVKNPKERLSLEDIDESTWLKMHSKEGRNICQEIWSYWVLN